MPSNSTRDCPRGGLRWRRVILKRVSLTMPRYLSALLALILVLVLPIQGWAGNYEVNVTRKASNIYRVDGKGVFIQTQYCYVYAYSEEAIFRSNWYGGELIFVDSRDKCDVKAVFGKANQAPGKYAVRVTRESDDWYEVFGANVYLQTSMCLSLALGQEAFLT
jgi:hypothetical protein